MLLTYIRQCNEDMDIWIAKNGLRCSGSILGGTYNSDIQYPFDDLKLDEDDEQDIEQEKEFDTIVLLILG